MIKLENLNKGNDLIYNLLGFIPKIVDEQYLNNLGVNIIPDKETFDDLKRGSNLLIKRIQEKTLLPVLEVELNEINMNSSFEIHNYTGSCPTLTYEVSPVVGCNVGCLYCLVSDGIHENKLKAFPDYSKLLEKVLAENHTKEHYFYYSAKTEAFQESTLQTGIAHSILKTFIDHYEKYPDSKARLFIASKAGIKQLSYNYNGNTIIELLSRLKTKAQFNTSLSIMPEKLRIYIEPYCAGLEERLDSVSLCQDHGILANSALVQPIIIPYITDEKLHEFFKKLQQRNIINFKPEFLTLCYENLSFLAQLLGHFDKKMEKELYESYISPDNKNHKKQRDRIAPSKELCKTIMDKIINIADEYDISTSLCYWVRKELSVSEETIPIINRNGFQCLGYQSKLWTK